MTEVTTLLIHFHMFLKFCCIKTLQYYSNMLFAHFPFTLPVISVQSEAKGCKYLVDSRPRSLDLGQFLVGLDSSSTLELGLDLFEGP